MQHDFSKEIRAAWVAYALEHKGTIALPPPCFEFGPYFSPHVEIGDQVECARFDLVRVIGWSNGPLRWPLCRVRRGGRASLILFADLARAVEVESATAVALAWGVCTMTVTCWRQSLDVKSINAGTSARMTRLMPLVMSAEQIALGRERASDLALHVQTEATKRARGHIAGKRTWTPAQVAQMGVVPDEKIAAQIGCHARTVSAERNRRGIASIQCGGTLPDLQTLDGARVRGRRLHLGLSQKIVAHRFGCQPCRISHIENGRSMKVTQATLDNLARALGCAPADLQNAT